MKWILPLLALTILSSCTTKPYMVGSVNDQFYKRHRTPGERFWKFGFGRHDDTDYSWQARLFNTARVPIRHRTVREEVYQETYVPMAPPPVTYSK
jgi:hypothetical protein